MFEDTQESCPDDESEKELRQKESKYFVFEKKF